MRGNLTSAPTSQTHQPTPLRFSPSFLRRLCAPRLTVIGRPKLSVKSSPNNGPLGVSDTISRVENNELAGAVTHAASEGDDERLFEEIKACEHVQDVLDIVADELTVPNKEPSTKRVVQALVKLAAIGGTRPGQRSAPSLNPETSEYLSLLDLIYGRVMAMKSTQLSSSLTALCKLRVKVPPAHLAAYCKAMGVRSGTFSARDIVSVLNSLATLKAKPSTQDMDGIGFRAYTLLRVQLQSPPSSSPSASDPSSDASTFTPQGISLLFHSSATLGYMNSKLIEAVSEAALVSIKDFAPQGVSNILWACGKIKHYDERLIESCLSHASDNSDAYQPQEIANILWSLVQLRHHPQQSARSLLNSLAVQLERSNLLDIASCLLCLATFSIQPGKETMGKICKKVDGAISQGGNLQPQTLCTILWSLAILGETSRPVFSHLAACLPELFEKGQLSDEGLLRQTFQAFLCSKLDDAEARDTNPNYSVPPITFPPPMIDAMKRSWVSMIQQAATRSTIRSARSNPPLNLVSALAAKLKVRHDVARVTKDNLALVDIALKPSEERFVALQVLRSFDHTRNTGQMMGPTLFQRRILERNGWEVKYLVLTDLVSLEETAQPQFMSELLNHLGCRTSSSSSSSSPSR